ncbi:hypothetical protein E2320_018525, partial [Naja naja]
MPQHSLVCRKYMHITASCTSVLHLPTHAHAVSIPALYLAESLLASSCLLLPLYEESIAAKGRQAASFAASFGCIASLSSSPEKAAKEK